MLIEEWHWEITTRCNLACLYCITSCGKPRKNELPHKKVGAALTIMKALGCQRVMLTGGEPLRYPHLADLLAQCSKTGIETNLVTNGTLVTKTTAQMMAKHLASVAISIDGSEAEVNDLVRGPGTFDAAKKAIELLIPMIPTSAFITVSAVNITNLWKAVKLCQKLGVWAVHVSEVAIAGRAVANRKAFELSHEQKQWLTKFATKHTGTNSPMTLCSADLSAVYVSSDGLVYPCSEIACRWPDHSYGHITSPDLPRKLAKAKKLSAGNTNLQCCYSVFAGNGIGFYLDNGRDCPLTRRAPE